MRFFEVDNPADEILAAAMMIQQRADAQGKQARLSMDGFLSMMQNAGITMDYAAFKNIFDSNPQLQNVIDDFNKDRITFKKTDADDSDVGYEEPQTDMPDDERVAKMAKSAMKTREFVEGKMNQLAQEVERVYKTMQRDDKLAHLADEFKDDVSATYDIRRSLNNVLPASMKSAYLDALARDGEMTEATNYGASIVNSLERIVDQQQADEIKFFDGKGKVDMYTASMFMNVYNKVNDDNKKKMMKMIETRNGFINLMKKLFSMKTESIREGMEDKIKKDIIAGMSSDAIIGKYANKRTTNIDEIRKMIQKIKWNMRKNDESVTEGFKIRDKSRGYGVSDKTYATRAEAEKARLLKMAQTGGDWEVIEERSLTKDEKNKMKSYEKKIDKADFIERYGKKEGEAIYYGTITNMAKKNA